MSYYFAKVANLTFEIAEQRVRELLTTQGFGVLTEIDVQGTLKKKLDVNFRPYKILGACNPPFAYKALQAEDKIGLMLPCNVIIQDLGDGKIEVAAINPLASMEAVNNDHLKDVAVQISSKLQAVIAGI